jgi:hypothetical protein
VVKAAAVAQAPATAAPFEPVIIVRDSIGTRVPRTGLLEYDIDLPVIRVDQYGVTPEQRTEFLGFWVNMVGMSDKLSKAVSYYGDYGLPGLVMGGQSGDKILGGAQNIMRELYRTFSFLNESPELKASQGVFGTPDFMDTYLTISQPSKVGFIDYILEGNPAIDYSGRFPKSFKGTINIQAPGLSLNGLIIHVDTNFERVKSVSDKESVSTPKNINTSVEEPELSSL